MKLIYLSGFLFISTFNPCQAADVLMHLTGNITKASCNIDTNETNIPVSLGDYSISDFTAIGSYSESKPFTISLKDCANITTLANFTFSGDENTDNHALLALSNSQGSGQALATGVGIELLNSAEQPIAINSTDNKYAIQPGDNTLTFKLRYKSTLENVTPGDASAVMFFDIAYE